MTGAMAAEPSDEALARARLQGRRLTHSLVIVVAVLFIGASTLQIVRAVFALGEPSRGQMAPDDPCVAGVDALTRRLTAAPPCGERSTATDAEAVARTCAGTSYGLDTWAAFQRLQLAKEELARRDGVDAPSPWRDVTPPLPVDLR
jgi:hypothetical protein